MSMLNGTEILIGFNCKFWAMENSNESVHLSNISSKTETDRDREMERERVGEIWEAACTKHAVRM